MAVRFDAASDRVAYTGGAPVPGDGFTITAWAMVVTDTNDFATFARLYNGGTAATVATSLDGLGGPNYFTAGGSVTSATGFVAGEWRKLAITRAATTGTVYAATPVGATEVDAGTVGGATTPTAVALGGRAVSDSSEWLNGRLAYVRVWSTALSQAEVEAEWASATPVRTSGLWADWPLAAHTDLTDHSGNGRHLSAGSTATTTEDGPPLVTEVTGSAAAALGALAGSAAGVRSTVGSAAAVFGGLVATAVGVRGVTGVAAASFGGLVAAAAGVRTVLGAAVAPLGGLTAAAVGVRTVQGVAVAALGGLTAHASGTTPSVVTGAATATLGGLVATVVVPAPAVAVAVDDGGWGSLLAIVRDQQPEPLFSGQYSADPFDRMEWQARQDRISARAGYGPRPVEVPVACPNDGEPLHDGPRGLHCPFDGWRPS